MRIIGHGIDMVAVSRIASMLSEHGEQFLHRCFTEPERAYMSGSRRYHEHLAARFAAKEAAMKALGTGLTGGVSWQDFAVVNELSGAPLLSVGGKAREIAMERGIDQWWLSLTHTDDAAVASVIAVDTGA